MWTAIFVATGLNEAMKIKEKLACEGFLIKIQLLAKEGDLDLYEILAPEFEASEVQSVLFELGII